jgi:hypothetical protein
MPHMHLRGKDMSFRLIHPNGQEVTVLKARFNFNWQLGYEVETPLHLPKGTRMVITAHHDNSANNPFLKGAEPDSDVQWGELTSQEMMLPWFGVLVEGDVRPDMIASYRPGDFDGALPTLRPPTPKPAPKAAPDAQKTPEILGESGSSRVDQSDIGFWVSRPVN